MAAATERDIQAALAMLGEGIALEGDPSTEAAGAASLLASIALAAEPMAPSPGARDRLLAATNPSSRFAGLLPRVQQLLDLGEAQARSLLDRIRDHVRDLEGWVDGDVDGCHYFHFTGGPRVAHADCGLVRLQPGVAFPRHRHGGSELSLVLAGRAIEGSGAAFEPGDLVVREAGSEHDFRCVSDEPFVFIAVLGDSIDFV